MVLLKEHLIPAVKEIIEKVDFVAGKMVINPLKGCWIFSPHIRCARI